MEKVHVTKEGLDALQAEYDDLVNRRRPEIIKIVAAARDEGDLKENGGYHAARNDQAMIEGRIRQLDDMLKRIEVIDEAASGGDTVRLGSTVKIDVDGNTRTLQIVGSFEANPLEGRISDSSPYGKALLGARKGQTVTIHTPNGETKARVEEIS